MDDVEQETMLAALRQPALRPQGLRAWLARVARNFAKKEIRADARRRAREARVARPEAELVDRVSEERWLVEAVLGLPEPYRTTILLRFYEGLAPAEIAARRGIPAGTARSHLSRALALLRERLDADGRRRDRNWTPLLLTIAAGRDASAAGLTATGALLMSIPIRIAIVVVVVLCLAATLFVTSHLSDSTDDPPLDATLHSDAGAAGAVGDETGETPSPTPTAPPTVIRGTVLRAPQATPIPGATVLVESASGLETAAGSSGEFALAARGAGPWVVIGRAEGFATGRALVFANAPEAEVFLVPSDRHRTELPGEAASPAGAFLGPSGEVPPMHRHAMDPMPPPEPPLRVDLLPAETTSPRGRSASRGFDEWIFWWAYRRGELLADRFPPAPDDLAEEVAREVRTRLLSGEVPEFLLPTALLISGHRPANEDPDRLMEAALGSTAPRIREIAVLALGRSEGAGDAGEKVRAFLHGVLADPEWGFRTRGYAALSLGLHAGTADSAARVLEESLAWGEMTRDLPVAKLMGLALSGRRESVRFVLAQLERADPRAGAAPVPRPDGPKPPLKPGRPAAEPSPAPAPPVPAPPVPAPGTPPPGVPVRPISELELDSFRGHVLVAFAMLAGPEAVPTLAGVDIDSEAQTRAALLGLGRVAPDADVVLAILDRTADPTARHYALIALGRIGARHRLAAEVCRTRLDTALEATDQKERAFAALGLALLGEPQATPGLRRILLDTNAGEKLRAAVAISLGLLGDRESVPALTEIVAEADSDADLTGAALESLGLLGDARALPVVLGVLTTPRRQALWPSAALAAGLLVCANRDIDSSKDPIRTYDLVHANRNIDSSRDPIRTDDAKAALLALFRSPFADTTALGQAGLALRGMADRSVVENLFGVAFDAEGTPQMRLLALSALARIADPRPVPLNARLAARIDYRNMLPFLGAVLSMP